MLGSIGTLCLIGILGATASTASDAAADFVVIVHPDDAVSRLTRAQVSDFFLRKQKAWPGGAVAVEPVDLSPSSPVRSAFSLAIHERPTPAVQVYWQRKIFTGQAVPHRSWARAPRSWPSRASDRTRSATWLNRP